MSANWGWGEFVLAVTIFVLLLDTHKRASRAMDAAERIERRLQRIEQLLDRSALDAAIWRDDR